MSEAFQVWVSLGGNIGSVTRSFTAARLGLRALSTTPLRVSPCVKSTPWGVSDQDVFTNQIVGLSPAVSPLELLRQLHIIEWAHGRTRETRWGPRTLDLDILYWPNLVRQAPPLILPHPRLHSRRFVLAPWAVVAPSLRVAGLDATVAELLAACTDGGSVHFCS